VRILYFGTYERSYPRNAQVVSALRRAGVEVVERNAEIWEGREQKWHGMAGAAGRLVAAQLKLLRRPAGRFDAVVVGYPGQADLPAARRAARGAPVVFNAMVSLYDTLVQDRARLRPGSLGARMLLAIDRYSFRHADLVVADTEAHADYFAALAGLPRDRVASCLLGAEDEIFHPAWSPPDRFSVLFVGKFAPLHGVETILEAARLLPEVPFRIVGSGQLDALLASAPANVERMGWVSHRSLPEVYGAAGCALGLVGTTEKAARVIPNKAFEALACGTPLVTADTPAARELLRDGVDALLVPAGDAPALAGAIERLAGDPALARSLSANGLETYRAQASEEVLGRRWVELIRGLL
jgi:glycosyltransferase involved in cell wall biosynthesis